MTLSASPISRIIRALGGGSQNDGEALAQCHHTAHSAEQTRRVGGGRASAFLQLCIQSLTMECLGYCAALSRQPPAANAAQCTRGHGPFMTLSTTSLIHEGTKSARLGFKSHGYGWGGVPHKCWLCVLSFISTRTLHALHSKQHA